MAPAAFVADLHLGAGAGRLEAQRAAWLEAVEISRSEAESLVILGDVFHRPRPTPDELAAFADGLDAAGDLPIVALAGNHDVSSASSATALEVLARGRESVLTARGPQTFTRSDYTLAVLPWSPLKPRAEDLLDVARALYLSCDASVPCALALHWTIGGALLPNGRRVDEVLRETTLPRRELAAVGFDVVLAGHIHRRQDLADELAAPMLYVGSLCQLDYSEAGGGHGVVVWTPESGELERFEVSSGPRFETVELEGPGEFDVEEFEPGSIVRVRYTATPAEHRSIDSALLAEQLREMGAGEVTIAPTIIREENTRGVELAVDSSPLESVQAWLAVQAGIAPELAEAMLDETQRYADELARGAS